MKKAVPVRVVATRQDALTSIVTVIQRCKAAMPDDAVDYELRELEGLVSAVEERWPLAPAVKQQMDIGPFAAKNISDWNAGLADALMHLDYELRHDGIGLSVKKTYSEPAVVERSVSLRRARRA